MVPNRETAMAKCRKLTQRTIIKESERCICNLAQEFHGEGAFYFRTEEDIRCRLFSALLQRFSDVEILHAQSRTNSPPSWYDLVIWDPRLKQRAKSEWRLTKPQFANEMVGLTLVAIEIDHLYGGTDKARGFTSYKYCRINPDISKLIKGIGNSFKYGYFLLFWDDDVFSKPSCLECSEKIDDVFEKLEQKYGLRSCCVSREGLVFVHGFKYMGLSNGDR